MQALDPSVRNSPLFTNLHSDVRNLIWTHLDGRSYQRLNLVCRALRHIVDNIDAIWKAIYLKECNGYCPEDMVHTWKEFYIRKQLMLRNFRCDNVNPHIIVNEPEEFCIVKDRLVQIEIQKKNKFSVCFYDQDNKSVKKGITLKGESCHVFELSRGRFVLEAANSNETTVMICEGTEKLFSKTMKDCTALIIERLDQKESSILFTNNDHLHFEVFQTGSVKPLLELSCNGPHQPITVQDDLFWLVAHREKQLVAYSLQTKAKTFACSFPEAFLFTPEFTKLDFVCRRGKDFLVLFDSSQKGWVFHLKERDGFKRIKKCRLPCQQVDHYLYGCAGTNKNYYSVSRWDLRSCKRDKKYSPDLPFERFQVYGNRLLVVGKYSAMVFNTEEEESILYIILRDSIKYASIHSDILYVGEINDVYFWDITSGKKIGVISCYGINYLQGGHAVGWYSPYSKGLHFNFLRPLPPRKAEGK